MGGPGSSNWDRSLGKKAVVEGCYTLDASRLQRADLLRPDALHSGGWGWGGAEGEGPAAAIGYEVNTLDMSRPVLRVRYTFPDAETFDYLIGLETTPPPFAGLRWWLLCPLSVRGRPCGRRARKLYLYGRSFGCRQCHRLTYRSCRESRKHASLVRMLAANTGLPPALARKTINGIGKRRD